jgi:hypothetical protein
MSNDSSVTSTPKWMYWVGWVLSVLPAPLLVMSAISKFTLPADVVKGFGDMGWTTDVAMALGIVELGSLVLYLVPQTAVLGAILSPDISVARAPRTCELATTAIAGFPLRWALCCGWGYSCATRESGHLFHGDRS